MNKKILIDKQALINKLTKYVERYEGATDEYYQGKRSAYEIALKSAKKLGLDEPQKPVVPKFVADWFEENKDDLDNAIFGYLAFWEERYTNSVLYQWFAKSENKPIETLVRMKDGYEVEKEPLYTVTINLDRKYHLVVDEGDGNDEISTTLTTSHGVLGYRYFLTEKEIKSADEKLWLIAVPVEEVVER